MHVASQARVGHVTYDIGHVTYQDYMPYMYIRAKRHRLTRTLVISWAFFVGGS